MSGGLGLPADLSTEGWRIDHALHVTHVLAAVLVAAGLTVLLVSLWRGRKREQARFSRGNTRRAVLVPLIAAAFMLWVVDGPLLYTSTRDTLTVFGNFSAIDARPDVIRIEVNAHQWAWDARYAGSDGRFGSADDVYVTTDWWVPRGRPVLIQLASSDVVHALNIPSLRVQTDAIPGRITQLWFQAARTGDADIVCGQLCGVSHYKMSGVLHIVEPDAYDAWLAQASRYAVKMSAAEKELDTGEPPPLFPDFAPPPHIAPRDWGWPWQEGRR